ncbi:MAG TPA: phage holin family protein [Capillimicrobium sp.]|nr:phage holin family protein [Capillimicrobium sp.]
MATDPNTTGAVAASQAQPNGAGPSGSAQQISAAIQEISERAQTIVREEIELAKVEVTEKVTKLAKGAAIGAAAGVFVLGGLLLLLHGLSWLAWWALPVGNTTYFWGFFLVAVILFVLGAIAGLLAARLFKSGSPPKPEMAIEEAQRVKETVST